MLQPNLEYPFLVSSAWASPSHGIPCFQLTAPPCLHMALINLLGRKEEVHIISSAGKMFTVLLGIGSDSSEDEGWPKACQMIQHEGLHKLVNTRWSVTIFVIFVVAMVTIVQIR